MIARLLARREALVALGAVLAVVACALPWGTTAGGDGMLPPLSYGFDGPGLLVLVTATAVLALLALPWALGHPLPPLTGPLPLVALIALGAVGLLVRAVQLLDLGVLGLPDRSPGFWLAALGVVVMAVGVANVVARWRSLRPPR